VILEGQGQSRTKFNRFTSINDHPCVATLALARGTSGCRSDPAAFGSVVLVNPQLLYQRKTPHSSFTVQKQPAGWFA